MSRDRGMRCVPPVRVDSLIPVTCRDDPWERSHWDIHSGDWGTGAGQGEDTTPFLLGANDDLNLDAGNNPKEVNGILPRGKWASGQGSVTNASGGFRWRAVSLGACGWGSGLLGQALWLETLWLGLGVSICYIIKDASSLCPGILTQSF